MRHTMRAHVLSKIRNYFDFEAVLLIQEISDLFSRVSQDSRRIIIMHDLFLRLQNGRRNLAANGRGTTRL